MPARRPSTPHPSFEQLISAQSSMGFWSEDKLNSLLKKFFSGDNVFDKAFQAAHPQVTGKLYATLIALYILEELFGDQGGESELIKRKARNYLISNGIDKPGNLLKELSLTIRSASEDDHEEDPELTALENMMMI